MTDQRYEVRAGSHVVVGIERDVAIAVAAQVHGCRPETRSDQSGCEKSVDGAEVAHAGNADHERAPAITS